MYISVLTKVVLYKGKDKEGKETSNKVGKITLLSLKRFPEIVPYLPQTKEVINNFETQKKLGVKELKPLEVVVSKETFIELAIQCARKAGIKKYPFNFIPIVYDSKSKVIFKIVIEKPEKKEEPVLDEKEIKV